MSQLKVIDVNDNEWDTVVKKCTAYDFYHTQSYHQQEKTDKPILIQVSDKDDYIAIPLVVREISETNFFDCTSVYGYCGPIANKRIDEISKNHISLFQNELKKYFQENNIVTVFSRLHPLIKSEAILKDFGEVKDINQTIKINLKISPEEQKRQYRKSNKSELNQLRRKGFQVLKATTDLEVEEFINIYNETMRRVGATDDYFFSKEYFKSFLNNKSFESQLLLAKFEGRVTAGAIFTITNDIMQYHLAGTSQDFIKDTPMKLIIDEARLLGSESSLSYLHLGGGVGGSDQDSLFRFKSGFSKEQSTFKVWKLIVNNELYKQLNRQKLNTEEPLDFFPAYRAIIK